MMRKMGLQNGHVFLYDDEDDDVNDDDDDDSNFLF